MADKEKEHPLWNVFRALQDYDDNPDLDKTVIEFEDHEDAEERRHDRKKAKGWIIKKILDDKD